MATIAETSPIDAFIARWPRSSGAERANFQMFAAELWAQLGVMAPDPAGADDAELYCCERSVQLYGASLRIVSPKNRRFAGRASHLLRA